MKRVIYSAFYVTAFFCFAVGHLFYTYPKNIIESLLFMHDNFKSTNS